MLLDTAMSLYGLEHSELYWEKAQVNHPFSLLRPALPGHQAVTFALKVTSHVQVVWKVLLKSVSYVITQSHAESPT